MDYRLNSATDPLPAVKQFWTNHPFYTSAVVLGIDVGLEGIGIYVRRGAEQLYAKTLLFDVPEPDRLLKRRQFRAGRHCRKNRHRRLRRLERLMAAHGLPTVSEDVLSRTDPFDLRHCALTKGLKSREGLSICIRHLVSHRGYDYYANIEGDYPWGSDRTLAKATDWVRSSYIDDGMAAALEAIAPELTGKNAEEKRAEFLALVAEKRREAAHDPIRTLLADYVAQKKPNFRDRARGYNFPRAQIEAHLREIIQRHRHLIDDPDGFIAALFLKPAAGSRDEKRRAIFHYSRKTTDEIEAVWERKVKACPFTGLFGLPPDTKVGTNADPAIRRWSLLQFLATRSFETQIVTGKGATKQTVRSSHRPSPDLVARLVDSVGAQPPLDWKTAKKAVIDDAATLTPGAKEIPSTQSPFNKDFFTHLQDLVCPSPANLSRRASLCPASAARLYDLATDGGRDFTPEGVNRRLNDIGFYDLRRTPGAGGVPYPQVTFLMGQRKKNGSDAGKLAVPGRLHRIFESLRDRLGGQLVPDYCVIEVVGTLPRNTEQKREIEKEQKERRAHREKLFAEHGREDGGGQISRRRIDLYDQQRGRCPYTGRELGDPHSPDLNIDHIFPQSRGGLSVDQNLVLTFQSVNHGKSGKGDRTPREAAEAGLPGFLSWPAMLRNVSDMKWGKPKAPGQTGGDRKIDVFSFVPTPERPVPDFGNTTRTAQLARQLVEEVAAWMGIGRDADERARRIGTPSGWLTSQARKTWIPEDKDRSRLIHHLVDAAVLAHIPPREGMNHIRCRGIFYPSEVAAVDPVTGQRKTRTITCAIRELGPSLDSLAALLHPEPEQCPVEKHRPRKRTASLGDSTFWRLDQATGSTYQRTALTPGSFATPEAVEVALRALRIPPDLMPSYSAIERWLHQGPDEKRPLCLKNGTPVRHGAKKDGKGSLRAPAGWSGEIGSDDSVRFLRSLSISYDRMEIWLGWDGKKWTYIKKLILDPTAKRHLNRIVKDQWDRTAPAWAQKKPDDVGSFKSWSELISGHPLPAGSICVGNINRRQTYRIGLTESGSIAGREESVAIFSWYLVKSVKSDERIEFGNLLYRSRAGTPLERFSSDNCLVPATRSPDILANLLGLPPAPDLAAARALQPPQLPASTHDSPPRAPRRRPATPRETGQADFGFAEDRD